MKNLIFFLLTLFFACGAVASKLSNLPDPTRPDSGVVKKSMSNVGENRGDAAKNMFSLQQTIVSPERKTAVINGKALSIGDKIGGATLISISNNKAFLQWKQDLIELDLVSQRGIKEASR